MDAQLINPFLDAVAAIMPQLGFKEVVKGRVAIRENHVVSKGVTVLIGMTHDVRGNVAYNMALDTAKKIASTMMMGMPVTEMDDMAQSAISEMVNMITANAAMNFERMKILVDISPPSLAIGQEFKVKVGQSNFLVVEMLIDSLPLELNIGLHR